MTLYWPINTLPPRTPQMDIAPRSLAAPASVSGLTQVVSSDAGIWKGYYGDIPIYDDLKNNRRITCWWALSALLEGRQNPILIPFPRRYQPNQDVAEELGLYEPVPHDDEMFFDDDTGYMGGANAVFLDASVDARGTSANIVIEYAGTIEPGQHFSIGERLHRIRSVIYTTENTATMTFRPPLREAAVAGTYLNFDEPICRMRLAEDEGMNLPIDYGRWSFPTVNFIEDV